MKRTAWKRASLAFTLIMVLFFNTWIPVHAVGNEPYLSFDYEQLKINFENELQASFIAEFGYDFVRNHNISVENAIYLTDSFASSRSSQNVYPNYFAGLYIDDNGNLVVLVTECNNNSYREINSLMANNRFANTIFRTVNYSYNELQELWLYLLQPDNEIYLLEYAQSWFVDIYNNRIVIRLFDYNEEIIKILKQNIIDSSMIVFEEACNYLLKHFNDSNHVLPIMETEDLYYVEIMPLNVITLTSGQGIYRRSPGGFVRTGSIGYRAVDQVGRVGFMTNAHGTRTGNETIFTNMLTRGMDIYIRLLGTNIHRRIGTVQLSHLQRTGDNNTPAPHRIDAAFVLLNPEPGTIINLNLPHGINAGSRSPIRGERVAIRGTPMGQTTASTFNRAVRDLHHVWNIGGATIDVTTVEMFEAPFTLIPSGVSGGIVWFLSDSRVAGINLSDGGWFNQVNSINRMFIYG
ncbi:MAG: hypothetical protein FWC71_01435 [Defluviitaleaceae bacterium]|nr:hypothetical protein [Defluviitaleaceae bacterium]